MELLCYELITFDQALKPIILDILVFSQVFRLFLLIFCDI